MMAEQDLRPLLQAATADQPDHVDLLKAVREQARPTRRRVLLPALASLATATAAVIGVVAVVAVVSITGAPSAEAQVAAAVEHTTGQSFRVHVTQDTGNVYDGTVDPAHNVGRITESGADAEWRYIGDTIYAMQDTKSSPAGTQWVAYHRPTPAEWTQFPAEALLIKLAPSDPQRALTLLRSATSVKDSGDASGAGWAGRHYTFIVPAGTSAGNWPAYASVTGAIDVDTQGQVRRVTFTVRDSATQAPKGPVVDLRETIEFGDFGTPVTVAAPPADQVIQDPGPHPTTSHK
jgi:hypothetical protein